MLPELLSQEHSPPAHPLGQDGQQHLEHTSRRELYETGSDSHTDLPEHHVVGLLHRPTGHPALAHGTMTGSA